MEFLTTIGLPEASLTGLFVASFLAATVLPGGSEAVLLAVLLVFVCASAGLGLLYKRRISHVRNAQAAVSAMQQGNAVIQVLCTDVMEYSTKNPAINPILQSFGLKPATTAAQPAKLPQK